MKINECAIFLRMADDRYDLLKAIANKPDEDTPRLAYADWLEEHDQPLRAALIRAQCAGNNETVAALVGICNGKTPKDDGNAWPAREKEMEAYAAGWGYAGTVSSLERGFLPETRSWIGSRLDQLIAHEALVKNLRLGLANSRKLFENPEMSRVEMLHLLPMEEHQETIGGLMNRRTVRSFTYDGVTADVQDVERNLCEAARSKHLCHVKSIQCDLLTSEGAVHGVRTGAYNYRMPNHLLPLMDANEHVNISHGNDSSRTLLAFLDAVAKSTALSGLEDIRFNNVAFWMDGQLSYGNWWNNARHCEEYLPEEWMQTHADMLPPHHPHLYMTLPWFRSYDNGYAFTQAQLFTALLTKATEEAIERHWPLPLPALKTIDGEEITGRLRELRDEHLSPQPHVSTDEISRDSRISAR